MKRYRRIPFVLAGLALLLGADSLKAEEGYYVGPTADGVIPQPSQDVLRAVGKWLKVNGESVYGAGATPFGFEFGREIPGRKDKKGRPLFDLKKDVRFTTKPGRLYVHLFTWPQGRYELAGLKGAVARGYFLADPARKPLAIDQQGEKLTVTLPPQAPDPNDAVLCLEMNVKQ